MIVHNPKFNYSVFSKETDNKGIRHYSVDGTKVPSVTTILSSTKDMSAIEDWKKRVGKHNAEMIVKESQSIGTSMHNYLENYALGITKPMGSNPIKIQAWKLAQIIIEQGLSEVSEFWGSEVTLAYENLYAGTSDLIGIHDGDEAIIDFKNSRRPKKEEYILDYKKQLVSYGLAHNHMYGTNIRKGVILMISREKENFGEFQKFELSGNQWDEACELWYKSIEDYYEMVG